MSPAEYQAKRDWLRLNPHGARAQMVRRELRAWERDLTERGETVDAWGESTRTRVGLSPWYVAIFHDRPGQPLASTVRHKDRYCQHLYNIGNEDVREATDSELEHLGAVRDLRMSADVAIASRELRTPAIVLARMLEPERVPGQ